MAEIADKTDADLNVVTPAGNVSLDRKTMKAVATAGEGTTIKIVLERKKLLMNEGVVGRRCSNYGSDYLVWR